MKVDVILGLQWGDEGKGKIVDVLASAYPAIARFQGGPNAGHSLQFEDKKIVLHTVPSGIFRKSTKNIIGNGVVIDPVIFKEECEEIAKMGIPVTERILISKKAHLILPTHKIIDAASEQSKGSEKIGSTLKGIGPTYMDKIGRSGLRVGDILAPDFVKRYNSLKEKHKLFLEQYNFEYNVEKIEALWFEAIEYLKKFTLIDGEYEINKLLDENKRILAEGAQGSLLDIDFGSYPFVTSSTTLCSGACIGLGVAPKHIGIVSGIFKAYCTRVGSGPFPTELNNDIGELLRTKGSEFGATTGRPRRTGWLDLVALKYTIMLNGVNKLIMMKADVLDTFDAIKVAVGYEIDGKKTNRYPFDTYAEVKPIYKEFNGWNRDLTKITKEEDLPFEFMTYVRFIEKEVGIPIAIISLGPDRSQTIIREELSSTTL